MKVKMSVAQRDTLRLALAAHSKLIDAAIKALAKALVPTLEALTAEALVDEARGLIPNTPALNEVWEITSPIRGEYRDALFILGTNVRKVREKEIDQGIDTFSSDKKLEEIQQMLRDLGDQRDLFAEPAPDEEPSEDKTQLELVGADA